LWGTLIGIKRGMRHLFLGMHSRQENAQTSRPGKGDRKVNKSADIGTELCRDQWDRHQRQKNTDGLDARHTLSQNERC
jgi:hypothetical protein